MDYNANTPLKKRKEKKEGIDFLLQGPPYSISHCEAQFGSGVNKLELNRDGVRYKRLIGRGTLAPDPTSPPPTDRLGTLGTRAPISDSWEPELRRWLAYAP